MIRLLIAGFAALILGLNLMMIHYALRITPESLVEIGSKLTKMGSIVTIIGFIILAIGLIRGFRGNLSPETTAILSAGSSVTVIGISTIISAQGNNNEVVINAGAWAATGIGFILVAMYAIYQYRRILISRIKQK